MIRFHKWQLLIIEMPVAGIVFIYLLNVLLMIFTQSELVEGSFGPLTKSSYCNHKAEHTCSLLSPTSGQGVTETSYAYIHESSLVPESLSPCHSLLHQLLMGSTLPIGN